MKKNIFLILAMFFIACVPAFAGQSERICVATKGNSPDSVVSDKAALAPYFVFFDEKGNFVEAIDNPFQKKTLEAGKLMANYLGEKGITAVIGTDYCGDIIGIFKKKGVTAYNFTGSAAEAARSVAQGKVPPALSENALVANHKVMMHAMRTGQEKIAVAASGNNPEALVNGQAAASPYLLFFNQKGELLEAIENPYKGAESPGPVLIKYISEKGATVVVAGEFGPKILDFMKAKQMWPIPFKGSAQNAVNFVLQNKKTK